MKDITPFHFLKHSNVCGYENIMEYLVSRLSYLKPSHPRWSEKKYGDFWKKERSEYVDQIKDIPLTHPLEQLTELSEHYQSLKALYEKTTDIKDKERLHKCMMQTHTHIYLISRDPSLNAIPTELTQERKTQALPKPDDSNIIDLQTQDVSPQLQTVGEKKRNMSITNKHNTQN